MGIFARVNYAAAAQNEPGINDFNAKNFPDIEKLVEDRSSGLTPTIDSVKQGTQAINNIQMELKDQGVFDLVEEHKIVEDELTHGVITPELNGVMAILLKPENKSLLDDMLQFFPRALLIINAYVALVQYQSDALAGTEVNGQTTTQQFLDSFGKFQSVIGKDSTSKLTQQWFSERQDNPPSIVSPWEMRIGGSRFFVPPISVNVSQSFQAGALSGGALRQSNTPKFNSGHSETLVEVTLYFPNHETIWGYDSKGAIQINFDAGGDSDVIVDQFMSSLRGLITQFKYAPFLPVRNEYLNKTYNITSVALKSMTVQTMEGFPFCLAVNLQMCKFNHKAYLPPIEDFNQAIHWGRFRQYIGRAAQKMNSVVNEGFLIQQKNEQTPGAPQPTDADPNQTQTYTIKYESDPTVDFNKTRDFTDGRNFDIYFPVDDPGQVFAPDTSDFRQAAEDVDSKALESSAWDSLMQGLGFTIDHDPQSLYDINYNSRNTAYPKSQRDVLNQYLLTVGATADTMDSSKLQAFVDKAARETSLTGVQKEEYINSLKNQWFDFIFTGWKLTPFFQNYLQKASLLNGNFVIKEWLVPMAKMEINWANVLVKGISVSMGNNLVNQQIQLQAEPVYQHIGGKDTSVNVSLVIFGEDDLVRLRLAFEHTNGLARLEHAHGTLGFLGIKNVVTALAGVKYVLPLDFQVETIPSFPHVYNVSMTFLDFDIFQQQREELSSTQQTQLVEAFGKRNPFFRIKQLWGAFNAYPDFPLSVRDDVGNIVGHLNPDFYFRSYQMYDNDIFNWGSPTNQGQTSNAGPARTDAAAISTADTARQNRIEQIQQLLKVTPDGQESAHLRSELAALQTAATANEFGSTTDNSQVQYQDSNTLPNEIETQGNYTHEVHWSMGLFSPSQSDIANIKINRNGLQFGATSTNGGDTQYAGGTVSVKDNLPEETLTGASTPEATPYSEYQSAHVGGSTSPFQQYELMMTDAAYRDISGRMIRAFPTYMLWLIDEGGRFAGVKLFDNFYGLQSVIDFSVVASEDILGDTLVLRLSNLYQKLTTPYAGYLNRTDNSDLTGQNINSYSIPDYLTDVNRNTQSGTVDSYLVTLEHIRLKPGVRLHLRMGYDSNPNSLQTIFNGVITEVRAGDIVEITAQSDAIELSPYVNTTNKNGSSGKIDGALNTGLWMSEPRDLMVRLLTMGSSSFKESVAAATNGLIFSENKFGIRHFGSMLYEPLNDVEKIKNDKRFDTINGAFSDITNSLTNKGVPVGPDTVGATFDAVNPLGGFFDTALGGASTRSPLVAVVQSMWVNAFRKRDYEVFKRNIYPGNGLGVAQFLGGDTLDGGQTLALAYSADSGTGANNRLTPDLSKTPLVPPGIVAKAQTAQDFQDAKNSTANSQVDPNAGASQSNLDKGVQIAKDVTGVRLVEDAGKAAVGGVSAILDVFSGKSHNPLMQALGLTGAVQDDDLKGFDEVSFRAQTYMKSVWDLFQMCAALLPNYIVAVRPFEDRSTVFYGKPHWLYTSGLVPITSGVGEKDGPKREGPDAALAAQENIALQKANSFSDVEQQEQFFTTTTSISPLNTTAGMQYTAKDLTSLPITAPSGATIPGPLPTKIAEEKHIQPSKGTHKDGPVPVAKGHSWAEGYGNSNDHGSFTITPEEEIWYMNMPWPYAKMAGNVTNPNYISGKTLSMYQGRRVIITSQATGKACVCAIGDFGPNGTIARGGRNAGASPDVMVALGIKTDDLVYIGFTEDSMQLGPITATATNTAESTSINDTLTADPNAKISAKSALTIEQIKNSTDLSPDEKIKLINEVTLSKDERSFQTSSDNDVIFAYKYGATPNQKNIPVWIAPSSKDKLQVGSIDVVGIVARRLYDRDYATAFDKSSEAQAQDLKVDSSGPYGPGAFFDNNSGVSGSGGRTLDQANDIWNEFRSNDGHGFPGFQETRVTLALWNANLLPNAQGSAKFQGPNVSRVKGGPDIENVSLESGSPQKLSETLQRLGAPVVDNHIQVDLAEHQLDQMAIREFMNFLWQDPYARAWLVITTTHHSDTSITSDSWDFNQSPVEELFQQFLVVADLNSFEKRDSKDPSKFDPIAIKQRNTLIAWMRAHNNQGQDTGNPIKRALQDITNEYDKTVGQLWKAISTSISSVLGLYRIALSQLGQGLESVNTMQKQANVLNKVFNDSIYYAEGSPGSITRLADNPFTREYGEPVIEIREPFQRMHYINSFQHIISNNITENLTGVSTVVTASSDGNYPVTVYFDKGSPPDRQVEKMVETGLFWDNAQGSGFFGFLHPLLHPIETARGLIKQATGSSDELLSKRSALYHLKESLKDIYMGEVVITGNPDIRPHDLIFLGDVYERMYGMFEVEQVVHHFTPETGFVTSITPNAVVTINDPSRWSMISWIHSWFAVHDVRTAVKYNLQQSGGDASQVATTGVTPEQLAQSLEIQFHGHRQYTNGNSALIRDLGATAALGNLGYETRDQAIAQGNARGDVGVGTIVGNGIINAIPGLNMIKDVLKAPFDWIKDNLVDQHGCYIQYLNKNGQPMDAGLSYNQGVAVGTHHSITLLPGILGLNVNVFKDGHKRITTNDLLKSLGWNEVDTLTVQKELSFWVDQTNTQVLKLAGKSPDEIGFSRPVVEIVKVKEVHDGDTFYSFPDIHGQTSWRLAGVAAAELPVGQVSIDLLDAQANIALRARSFLIKRLIDDPIAQGAIGPYPTVAVRLGANAQTFNRTAAVIFHNVPAGIDQAAPFDPTGTDYPSNVVTLRDKFLYDEASKWPMVEWDSYMDDGQPATINWEVISAGLASVMLFGNQFNADKGVLGLGRGG